MLDKITSSGRSGAEQAARRAAEMFGTSSSGWMPKGFVTEDGLHPEFAQAYGAAEMPAESKAAQTEPYVRDSDGILCSGVTTTAAAHETVGGCHRLGKSLCRLIRARWKALTGHQSTSECGTFR
jgi:hypothetical protein